MQGLAGLLSWLFTAHVGTANLIECIFTVAAAAALVLTIALARVTARDRATTTNDTIFVYAAIVLRSRWKGIGLYGGAVLIGFSALLRPPGPITSDTVLWGVGITLGLLIFLASEVQDVRAHRAIARKMLTPPPS